MIGFRQSIGLLAEKGQELLHYAVAALLLAIYGNFVFLQIKSCDH